MNIDSLKERSVLLTGSSDDSLLALAAQNYAGEISYMDQQVGRLLEYLKQSGILDQSLLIITSDHGENLWDHQPYFDHGMNTYQSCMKAMCLIRMPEGKNARKKPTFPVQSIDILPSILNYLRINIPENIDGISFDLERLTGVDTNRSVFCEATKPHPFTETDPRWINIRKTRCVFRGGYKYVFTPFMNTQELYDVKADPYEQNNLISSNMSDEIYNIKRDLSKALESWTNSAHPLPSEFNPDQFEDTVNKLKAMGYI